jgi:hypothetical protein
VAAGREADGDRPPHRATDTAGGGQRRRCVSCTRLCGRDLAQSIAAEACVVDTAGRGRGLDKELSGADDIGRRGESRRRGGERTERVNGEHDDRTECRPKRDLDSKWTLSRTDQSTHRRPPYGTKMW